MKGTIGLLFSLLLISGYATAELRIYTEQYPPYNMTTNGQPFAHSKKTSQVCAQTY